MKKFSVRNAGEITLSVKQHLLSRTVEMGRIDRASQIGEEHSAALEVERDADAFHEVGQHDVWSRARAPVAEHIQGGAADGVAARRVAAVGPVEEAILEIELEIDRLWQAVEQHFDVGAI